MATFFDSLKKWFYTKNSSAASSDARVPLLDASGNPKGSDTMDNLASVLGEKHRAAADLNNATSDGLYLAIPSTLNKPSGESYGYVRVFTVDPGSYIQTFYSWYLEKIYFRRYTNQWEDWVQQSQHSYLNPYTDLASLASALGVGKLTEPIETLHVPASGSNALSGFGDNYGYRVYMVSRPSEGRCCLVALEWNNATIIWDGSSYFNNLVTFSVAGQTLTITNKTNTDIDLKIY